MLYTKYGKQEIPIDELFTRCFNCNKEIEVDSDTMLLILQDGGDLYGTQISCCSGEKPTLIRIK